MNRPHALQSDVSLRSMSVSHRRRLVSRLICSSSSHRRLSTKLKQTSKACEDPSSDKQSFVSGHLCDLSVSAVLLASFLNLLGFTMASPIQPALGEHFSLPMGASFGSLSSAYPLGMMLGVFMWPTLSDIIGRKIVMTLTLFGSGMGLILQSLAVSRHWTLEQFLVTRVLTGCFAGNSPISKAYLADRGSEGSKRDLTKYLAWKDASSTMAFIVGPILGGLLYRGGKNAVDNTGGLSFVIRFSAICSLIASMTVALCMKDKDSISITKSENQSTEGSTDTETKKAPELMTCPLGTKLWTGVATVAAVSALYHAADSAFFAFFPSLLQQKLQLDTGSIGMAFTSFAFVSFTMSAFVSSRFIQRYGPVASCATGLGTIATALFTLSYVASHFGIEAGATAVVILAAAAFYYIGVPLYGPTVPTMLLQCVPPRRRGAVMGFDGTINTIARVISPLVMGDIYRRRGAGACFGVAGCFASTAASLALIRRWIVLRKDFSPQAEMN